MSIQLKKKLSLDVNNAIDSEHASLFIDPSDNVLKSKDETGIVTPAVAGVASVEGRTGTITISNVKDDLESVSDTNFITDSQVEVLDGLMPSNHRIQSTDLEHPGPIYNNTEPCPDLSIPSLSEGVYKVKWTLFMSQPLISTAYDFKFYISGGGNIFHGFVSYNYLNTTISSGTATLNVSNTAGANNNMYITIEGVFTATSTGPLGLQFGIDANSASYRPTMKAGSFVEYTKLA